MSDATVVGARGFIGSALVSRLQADGLAVAEVGRGETLPDEPGHLFFCAGLTADFREHLHETVESHVTLLSDILLHARPLSLTYLSSTRVYLRAASGEEEAVIPVDPLDPGDIYNLSKLTAEALCLADPRPTVRVVRLATVVGAGEASPSFLSSLIEEARQGQDVVIRAGPGGAKDYVALEDAVAALALVPRQARSRILNVASGRRTTNREIAALLTTHFGIAVAFEAAGAETIFPEIRIDRMRTELGIEPEPTAQVFARLFGAEAPSSRTRPAAARLT